jgi:Mg2+/Co2+ transporter CorB
MELASAILFMLLAGFFAGSETAFISVDRMQLHANTDMKDFRYRILHWLLDRIEDVQGMFLIGTNICIVTSTILFSSYLMKVLSGDPLVPLYVTLIMTPFVLLLSDVIPKIIFRHFADGITHSLALIYLFFFIVLFPVEFLFIRVIKSA